MNYEFSTDWLDEGDNIIIITTMQRHKCG